MYSQPIDPKQIVQKPYIVHLACWAHARWKFAEVVKAGEKGAAAVKAPKSLPMRLWNLSTSCT